jgi:hypothetical protein
MSIEHIILKLSEEIGGSFDKRQVFRISNSTSLKQIIEDNGASFVDVVANKKLAPHLPYIMKLIETSTECKDKMICSSVIFDRFNENKIKLDGEFNLGQFRLDFLYIIAKIIDSWSVKECEIVKFSYDLRSIKTRRNQIEGLITKLNTNLGFVLDINIQFWDFDILKHDFPSIMIGMDYQLFSKLICHIIEFKAKTVNDVYISSAAMYSFFGMEGRFSMFYMSLEVIYYVIKCLIKTPADTEQREADKLRRQETIQPATESTSGRTRTPPLPRKLSISQTTEYKFYSFDKGTLTSVKININVLFGEVLTTYNQIAKSAEQTIKIINDIIDSIKEKNKTQKITYILIKLTGDFNDKSKADVMLIDQHFLHILTHYSKPPNKPFNGTCDTTRCNNISCSAKHTLQCKHDNCNILTFGHINQHVVLSSSGKYRIHPDYLKRLTICSF